MSKERFKNKKLRELICRPQPNRASLNTTREVSFGVSAGDPFNVVDTKTALKGKKMEEE